MKKFMFLLVFVYSFSLELAPKILEPEEAFKHLTKKEDSFKLQINFWVIVFIYMMINLKYLFLNLKNNKEFSKNLNHLKYINYEEFIVHFTNMDLNHSI
ncbi:MAG: hypothetical protein R2837_11170 [Aliarcobacter sp.]